MTVRILIFAQVGDDASVTRCQHGQGPAAKGLLLFAHREHAPRPIEQRVGVPSLRFNVNALESV